MKRNQVPQNNRAVLIEDDEKIRRFISEAMRENSGYELIQTFAAGIPAITSIKELNPALALVDVGLPDISGVEVIAYIAKELPTCDALVVSTFGDEATVFGALEAGARGYVLKGVSADELRQDIRSLREGGSPLSPAIARKVLNRLAIVNTTPTIASEDLLTAREKLVLEHIGRGASYANAATHCGISHATVHAHLKSIYRKLAVHSNVAAIYEARRRKLIP